MNEPTTSLFATRKAHGAIPATTLPTLFLMLTVACGSGGGDSGQDAFEAPPPPSAPMATVQEEWIEADFDQYASEQAEMAALVQALDGQGFVNYVTSGRIEDETGVRLDFGTYSNGSGDQKTAVRHCGPSGCVGALARIEGESIAWTDESGTAIDVRKVAVPYLLRQTMKQDPDGGTYLVSALAGDTTIDPSALDLNRRRLLVANQFGGAFGLTGETVAGSLADGGLFTEAVFDDYVTWQALSTYLTSSYPHEVLVVLAQPLRQLYRDSEDPSDRWYRTLGIEVQNGLYGFDWVSAETLGNAMKQAPLSGPGVILWLGGESLGDETKGMSDNPESTWAHLAYPGKVVAGFLHQARPELLLAASKEFLERLGDGQSAGEARDGANALLQAWGAKARLAFAKDSDEDFRLAPARSDFWGDKIPKTGIINPFLILRPWCKKPNGKEEVLMEMEGNPWIGDLVLDGPVFRGARDHEVGPDTTLHMEILGVLGEIREGAHFYFVFQGGLKKEFPNVTLYANAEITEVVNGPESLRIRFKGTGEVLPFTDSSGQDCTFKYMLLEPLIGGTGKFSELTLEY